MEKILDSFFEDVFSELDRAELHARYKRRNLVEYLSTVIQASGRVTGQSQEACKSAVISAINFHKKTRVLNGRVCLMGKYHNVLYVAARLAFDWKLDDTETVCELLDHMFICEGTFDRLMTGAIFGSRASGVISGWKSDFDTREECLEAVRYFARHAILGRKQYHVNDQIYNIAEVPMESCGKFTPATVAVQATRPDVLLFLLQLGAQAYVHEQPCPLIALLTQLGECSAISPDLQKCQDIIMRAVPVVAWPDFEHPSVAGYSLGLKFLPDDRISTAPSLKHLSRCTIRKSLNGNSQLPYGIERLKIPQVLKSYLNLEE